MEPIYFEKDFAKAINWHQVVGFDSHAVLVLEKDAENSEWVTDPVPADAILEIRVRRCRSVFWVLVALGATALAGFVAYAGIIGAATGIGVFILPLILVIAAAAAFAESKRMRLSYVAEDKPLSADMPYRQGLQVLAAVKDWARRNQVDLAIPAAIESDSRALADRRT